MRRLPARTGTRLVLGVLLVYSVCPPFTSFDSYWVVPTALSILSEGNLAVDEYLPGVPETAHYSVECVPAKGPAVGYGTPCPGGHWYNFFPDGVAILALPAVLAMKVVTGIVASLFPGLAAAAPHPIIAAFLAGDLVGGQALVQLWSAALFGAIAAWLMFRICARFLSERQALGLALLFAFGTSQWSTASRSLLQHGPSVMALTAALYLIVLAEDRPWLVRFAAIPLAVSFVLRPSNFISVVALTAFVAVRHRKQMLKYLLWSLPVAVPFLASNLLLRHSLFPRYYNYASGAPNPYWFGFEMNLYSPSRGLLLFTPIVLISAAGMMLAWRKRWCYPLAPFLIAVVTAHMFFIPPYWPGHSYGPRYWADMSHLFVFFLIPAVLHWQKMRGGVRLAAAAVFVVLAGWGVLAHGRGATSNAAQQWNRTPVNVDEARQRVFDWHDPQFMRGLR